MSDDRALIHFRCVNPKHTEPRGGESDTLTIHEGKWAYCPHDIRAAEHTWEETGGIALNELRRLSKPRTS